MKRNRSEEVCYLDHFSVKRFDKQLHEYLKELREANGVVNLAIVTIRLVTNYNAMVVVSIITKRLEKSFMNRLVFEKRA